MIEEFIHNGDEPDYTGWHIDSPSAADWAIEQIKAERARRDIYINAAEERIAEYNEKIKKAREDCENHTSFLLSKLNDYLNTVPVKETKTQFSFTLPAGKLVRTKSKQEYQRDDSALLAFVKSDAPEYVRVKEEVAWSDLKRDLVIAGDVAVLKATGEVVPGITVIESPETFDIK